MGTDSKIATCNQLVLFDGVCVFCNSSVDFILNHETSEVLQFVPLQSDLGKSILVESNYPIDYLESILFLKNGKLLNHSDAVLAIASYLRRPYSWLSIFRFIPLFLRNWVYQIIAKNRYNWFGKNEACRLPTPDLRKRFLE